MCARLCQVSIECHLPYFAAKLNNAFSLVLLMMLLQSLQLGLIVCNDRFTDRCFAKFNKLHSGPMFIARKLYSLTGQASFSLAIAAPCFLLLFQVVEVAAIVAFALSRAT